MGNDTEHRTRITGTQMRKAATCLLGKRIVGVLRRAGARDPKSQVFLVFDDGTHFEFYGEYIQLGAGVGLGGIDRIRRILPEPMGDSSASVTEECLRAWDIPPGDADA